MRSWIHGVMQAIPHYLRIHFVCGRGPFTKIPFLMSHKRDLVILFQKENDASP